MSDSVEDLLAEGTDIVKHLKTVSSFTCTSLQLLSLLAYRKNDLKIKSIIRNPKDIMKLVSEQFNSFVKYWNDMVPRYRLKIPTEKDLNEPSLYFKDSNELSIFWFPNIEEVFKKFNSDMKSVNEILIKCGVDFKEYSYKRHSIEKELENVRSDVKVEDLLTLIQSLNPKTEKGSPKSPKEIVKTSSQSSMEIPVPQSPLSKQEIPPSDSKQSDPNMSTPKPSTSAKVVVDDNIFLYTILHDLDVSLLKTSEEELLEMYESYKYIGFNGVSILKTAAKIFTAKGFCQISLIGALRGSNMKKIGDMVVDTNKGPQTLNKLVLDGVLKKSKADVKHDTDLTVLRMTAAFPEGAAFLLYKANVPKRISDCDLPGFLQFPASASIRMNDTGQKMTRDFNEKFTKLVNTDLNTGKERVGSRGFNEQILKTMYANSRALDVETFIGHTLANSGFKEFVLKGKP